MNGGGGGRGMLGTLTSDFIQRILKLCIIALLTKNHSVTLNIHNHQLFSGIICLFFCSLSIDTHTHTHICLSHDHRRHGVITSRYIYKMRDETPNETAGPRDHLCSPECVPGRNLHSKLNIDPDIAVSCIYCVSCVCDRLDTIGFLAGPSGRRL